jgi:mono/diheme cytochrome c family protein
MVRLFHWLPMLALAASASFSAAQAQQGPASAFTPKDERMEDLPEAPGRDETFGLCTACHGYRLVSNQGMTRDKWDETMTWMTERHGMPDIQGADRDLILDYLATHHPPKAPAQAGGFRNPFAPQ